MKKNLLGFFLLLAVSFASAQNHSLSFSRWNATDANLRNNNVVITNGPALNGGTTYTLEAWAKPMQDSTNYMILGNDSTSNASAPYIMLQRAKQVQFGFGSGTANYSKIAAVAHNNLWNHYAVTYDGAVLSLYVNGVLKDTMQRVASISDKKISCIGGSKFGTSRKYFNGCIDEVRVWNTCRTAQQIAASTPNTLVGNEAGLVMLYTFEGTATDLTGNSTAVVNNATFTTDVFQATTRPALTWVGGGTDGVLNIAVTTDTVFGTGRFGLTGATRQQKTKNIFTTYITKEDGTFVKSINHYGARHSYELFFYHQDLGNYAPDVNSGATLLTHNTYNLTWDGTDFNGNKVDDGNYNVNFEVNDHSAIYPAPQTKYGDFASFTFTKGASSQALTPANDSALKNFNIAWVPTQHSLSLSRWNATDANLRNNNVVITNGPALNGGTTYTLEAWAKPMQDSTNYMILGNDSTSNASAPYIMLQRAKQVQFGFGSGTTNYSKIAAVAHNNLWNHYAVTYDGAVLSLYVNGELKDTLQRVASITDKKISCIGGSKFGTSRKYYNGMIDEVRVWNTCRTAQQIAASAPNTLVGNEAGLVMLYTFEGEAIDLTGNSTAVVNNGTFSTEGYQEVTRPAFSWVGGGTNGVLNITVTTDTVFGTGRFGLTGATRAQKTKNIFTTYITKEDGTFVKTINHYGARHSYELFFYHTQLGNYAPDVNSGATLLTHNTYNLTWDGTDYNGDKVDDGNYNVNFEVNDHSAIYPAPQTKYGDYASFTFTKSAATQTLTPANDSALKGFVIVWNPDVTSVNEINAVASKEVKVYPNPAVNQFNVSINEAITGSVKVRFYNMNGQLVAEDQIEKGNDVAVLSYNVEDFQAGIYTVEVVGSNKTQQSKIVITK